MVVRIGVQLFLGFSRLERRCAKHSWAFPTATSSCENQSQLQLQIRVTIAKFVKAIRPTKTVASQTDRPGDEERGFYLQVLQASDL